jgi:hypothetical protein
MQCQEEVSVVYLQDTLKTSMFARNMLPACYGPAGKQPIPPGQANMCPWHGVIHELGSLLHDVARVSMGLWAADVYSAAGIHRMLLIAFWVRQRDNVIITSGKNNDRVSQKNT